MTRRRVAEGNDRAKGISCNMFPIGIPDRGEDENVGLEKAMANRSSCSRP